MHRASLLMAFFALKAAADPVSPAVPPPPTILFNYGTYHSAGASPAVAPPASPAPSASVETEAAPRPLKENEPVGFTLGLLAGVFQPSDGKPTPTLGLAANYRCLRFLSLEGEALLGKGGSRGTLPHSANAQAVAQVTFHSVLFDFTPRFGIGYTSMATAGWRYSGSHLMLGGELGLGDFRLSAEVRGPVESRSTAYYAYGSMAYP
jgi:hypothetical protein